MEDTNFKNNEQKIIRTINEKVSHLKCPICSHSGFTLVGGYFTHDIQKDLISRQMGGQNIPTVPIVCKNCGYIMEFAAGALNLLPQKDQDKND